VLFPCSTHGYGVISMFYSWKWGYFHVLLMDMVLFAIWPHMGQWR